MIRTGALGGGPTADYATVWHVARRQAPGASVCVDPDCHLSGGYAHVGDCEPCTCGKEHAAAECPDRWCFTCEAPKSERRAYDGATGRLVRVEYVCLDCENAALWALARSVGK